MKTKKSKFQIVDQIKKLMKLAESEKAIGNVAAAERCAEKIVELRAKHGIEAEIVLDNAPVDFDGEPYFTETSPLFRRRRIFWQVVLGGSTAQFFGCRTIVFKKNNLQVVIGDEAGRKAAIECFHLLYKQGTEKAKNLEKDSDSKQARLQSQSFLLGFAFGVQARFSGYKYNESQLNKFRHHLLESAMPVDPQGIVKSERIALAEETARQARIEEATSGVKPAPEPKKLEVDGDAYVEGVNFGHSCEFPEAVEAAAQKVYEQLEEIEREMRRKRDEEMRQRQRERGFYIDLGTPSGSYTATTRVTYRGTQMNFDFE